MKAKQTLKHLLGAMLAVMLVFSMMLPVMAADPTVIIKVNTTGDYAGRYQAYQVFKGDLVTKEQTKEDAPGENETVVVPDTLASIQWGDGVNKEGLLKAIKDINGFKVGFLNYTYGTNGISPRDGVVVDYIDREQIKADADSTRNAGAELLCVCIHWGDEYKLLPNKTQKQLADFLEAIGVDMIIGAHPHVIQPMELRPNRYYPEKNVLLVYSLGNFISNMKTADTRGGALVSAKLFRGDDKTARVSAADYRLLFTVPGTSPASNYRLMEADSVSAPQWKAKAQEFASRARGIFNTHNIGVGEYRSPAK